MVLSIEVWWDEIALDVVRMSVPARLGLVITAMRDLFGRSVPSGCLGGLMSTSVGRQSAPSQFMG